MSNIFSLKGKVALVTGASSGLGAHLARLLASEGVRVAIAARRADKLVDLAHEIETLGQRALPVEMDVTEEETVERAFARAETELGAVSIVINNAGIASGGAALSTPKAEWQAVIDTNLTGAWTVAQAAAQHMVRLKQPGSIINTASVLGQRASAGLASYCAAKAGLINLTRVLAIEWARYDIRVNALAPGYIITDINRDYLSGPSGEAMLSRIPQRRFGDQQDLDGPVLLLASDASRHMTGSVITVDGGHSINF